MTNEELNAMSERIGQMVIMIEKINEHYKKTNWLCLKDYIKMIDESKKQFKYELNKTNTKKTA